MEEGVCVDIRQYTMWKVIEKSVKALVESGIGPEVSINQHGWQWEKKKKKNHLGVKQRKVTTNWKSGGQNKTHVCIKPQ